MMPGKTKNKIHMKIHRLPVLYTSIVWNTETVDKHSSI